MSVKRILALVAVSTVLPAIATGDEIIDGTWVFSRDESIKVNEATNVDTHPPR